MNPNEPQWYRRLTDGPFRQEPRPTEIQLQSIKEEVMKVRKQQWYWKTSVAGFFIALSVFILFTWVIPSMELTSPASNPTNNSNFYSGIEKNDIPDISNTKNIEFVHEYKGHSDNWAAVYIIYKVKDSNKHMRKLLLKYIGKKPNPIGELSYAYDAGGDDVRSGTMSFTDEPKDGIYYLGPLADNESAPDKDSIVKLLINWNMNEHSETIELQPEQD
ncbi:hypothetical protein BK120_30365 [Paenibacillus sp. FSL A5-0031]|uniref:hypothetical protein n=1 Tax=Paenibacillus sp. FSL A5-0031 TaxID=1920420 RepID=UPI00096E5148|nr:hypothetical protein [Paenibacillus sp. FSL A5-0031]OME75969.1 hypothetical protein BK120_30365 [Paenibacillus sp. FSL A5-0031]